MSEETVVESTATEEVPSVEQTSSVAKTLPEEGLDEKVGQQVQLNDLRIAYVVGLTPEGNFVFEVFGKEKGLVEVLGIHEHATRSVNKLYNEVQLSGDRLVHEIGRGISVLNQKLDQLLVANKKPDNAIQA